MIITVEKYMDIIKDGKTQLDKQLDELFISSYLSRKGKKAILDTTYFSTEEFIDDAAFIVEVASKFLENTDILSLINFIGISGKMDVDCFNQRVVAKLKENKKTQQAIAKQIEKIPE